MRLWSLHPRYLDGKGLVALWREALLARKALREGVRGYGRHPQLERFRDHPDPFAAIDCYLAAVHEEAVRRGYRFDRSRFAAPDHPPTLTVTEGQLAFELEHLKHKLARRAPECYRQVVAVTEPESHPLFVCVPGDVEPWERGELP